MIGSEASLLWRHHSASVERDRLGTWKSRRSNQNSFLLLKYQTLLKIEMIDMIEKEDPVISEEEAAQYDRQIRLWGLDAQKRSVSLVSSPG